MDLNFGVTLIGTQLYITNYNQQITYYRAMNLDDRLPITRVLNTEIRIMVSGLRGYCYSLLIAPLCRREDDIHRVIVT